MPLPCVRVALVLIAVLAVSCGGGDSPTQPTVVSTLDGSYSGHAIGGPLNLIKFLLTATVAGGSVTGTLGTPNGAAQIPLSGTASAAGSVTMNATDQCGGAVYTLTGSITHDSSGRAQITGTWSQTSAAGCAGSSGTFTMVRARTDGGSNLFPAGTWVGTLSRPAGDSFAVTWVATRYPPPVSSSNGAFDGPLTLTYRGVTVTARMFGVLAGSNTASNGYQLNFTISLAPGDSSVVPNCNIGSTISTAISDNLRDSSTTIDTHNQTLVMRYDNCYGFTTDDPAPTFGSGETARLVLHKQ